MNLYFITDFICITLFFCVLAFIAIAIIFDFFIDKKKYNNGICPLCGDELVKYDDDEFGYKWYKCANDNCKYICRIGREIKKH